MKRNFPRIWIAMEKPLVKRGPGLDKHCWESHRGPDNIPGTHCNGAPALLVVSYTFNDTIVASGQTV